MKKQQNQITNRKLKSILSLATFLAVIILVNIASQVYFKRFDLTTDHRYSLNDFSKNQLENLEDIVFLRVYLDGDLPASFKQLQNSTKEILDEIKSSGSTYDIIRRNYLQKIHEISGRNVNLCW